MPGRSIRPGIETSDLCVAFRMGPALPQPDLGSNAGIASLGLGFPADRTHRALCLPASSDGRVPQPRQHAGEGIAQQVLLT